MKRALYYSEILRSTPAETVIAELKNALEEISPENNDHLPANVLGVGTAKKGAKHYVFLELDEQQLLEEAKLLRNTLQSLGGIEPDGNYNNPHITLGTFDRNVPSAVIPKLEKVLPNQIMLGRPIITIPGLVIE
jgi:hypothetical protein